MTDLSVASVRPGASITMFTWTRAAGARFRLCGGAEFVLLAFPALAADGLLARTALLSIGDLVAVLSAEAHLISIDFAGAIFLFFGSDTFGDLSTIGTRKARLVPLWKLARFCFASEKSPLVFAGSTFAAFEHERAVGGCDRSAVGR